MEFAFTVWRLAGARRTQLGVAIVISMVSVIGVLALINMVVENAGNEINLPGLLFFALAASGVVVGNAVGQRCGVAVVEEMLHRLRLQLAGNIRRLECDGLETVGSQRIYDSLTRNSALLSEAAMVAAPMLGAVGALVLGGFYTLALSPVIFGAVVVLMPASVFFFRLTQRHTVEALNDARATESRYLGLLGHLLHGFKEVKLHRPRGDAIENDFLAPTSEAVRNAQEVAGVRINRGISVSYTFFYILMAVLAFLLPPLIGSAGIVVQGIYVAIFLLSLVEIIVKSLPLLTRASFALAELRAIETRLEAGGHDDGAPGARASFERIELAGLTYSYRDAARVPVFTVGPVDLEITRGELLFLVGGNGSGKSTFLKVLCRLYQPDSGTLLCDGQPVEAATVASYRSLFSAVFADFHLFDRLYGLGDRPEAEVNALLAELGIGHKTRYEAGQFTETDLSTGQRKRLAFAVALLEHRPILVLDELAADQDPEFRERFYRQVLPRLRAEGRTLIVVSHDERYFDLADRLITLRDGRIVSLNAAGEEKG